jgi:hypothetical protein
MATTDKPLARGIRDGEADVPEGPDRISARGTSVRTERGAIGHRRKPRLLHRGLTMTTFRLGGLRGEVATGLPQILVRLLVGAGRRKVHVEIIFLRVPAPKERRATIGSPFFSHQSAPGPTFASGAFTPKTAGPRIFLRIVANRPPLADLAGLGVGAPAQTNNRRWTGATHS